MKPDIWNHDAFTPAELAELHKQPPRILYRNRIACPFCGSFKFRVTTTKHARDDSVTRYCECRDCEYDFKIVDIAEL